ncbi:hypothetical protein Sme01_38310 [Sphaerisporangium melleum]|uniref:Uncharacterized protein n=1 Tax=Sphaerisporangium melleum TaxID=321316 RepID=A0A917R1T1_9ACTN|nr:hypothetical protein [Sphaerisporangium melleum]GGK82290.1 hypothetical protein GCM10007964_26180 [Sphaerisporangium melleum]GII71355.1 hypothetical protein Sme01_38310 [Sphaerisporangium melleum]
MTDLSFDDIRQELVERSDGEALLADGLEDALIGTAEGWFGNSHRVVALYDLSLCVRVLMSWGMDEEEADEYIGYNITGAYAGPSTPVFGVIHRQPLIVSCEDRDLSAEQENSPPSYFPGDSPFGGAGQSMRG